MDCEAGLLQENVDKNRFKDVLPGERHRLCLQTRVLGTNDYINAVYIDVCGWGVLGGLWWLGGFGGIVVVGHTNTHTHTHTQTHKYTGVQEEGQPHSNTNAHASHRHRPVEAGA